MWHHPSCWQLLMLSWRRTGAYSGQHLPILMMCMWMRVLCLRHVWRSISTASASSARSRRGYRMVHECLCYRSGERITLCIGEEEQNPRHASCRHATEHIFTMQQIGWTPSCGWLASCSCGVHQAESIWRHRWMGWQNWRYPSQQQAVFKPGDRVYVKTPHGRCTTKYKVGRVTGITSAQNITINGMPRHVKDLRPIERPGRPTVCSDIVSENASERFVTIRERPCEQAPNTIAGDASSNNTSNEDLVTI